MTRRRWAAEFASAASFTGSSTTANPAREFDEPEPDTAGLTEFTACTGLHQGGTASDEWSYPTDETIGEFDSERRFAALRESLRAYLPSAPDPKTPRRQR